MPPGWLFFLRDMLSLVFTIGLSAAIRMSARWTQNEAARKEAERNRAGSGTEEPAKPTEPSLSAEYAE